MLEDPLGVDRRLKEAWGAFVRFRAELHAGRGAEHAFEHLGARASLELVSELRDAGSDPLAPALLRLCARLHEEHAVLRLEVEYARAFRSVRHPLDAPERAELTLAELLARALADAKRQRRAYLAVLFERGTRATDLALRRAERRAEVRAALAGRVAPDFDLPGPAVVAAAERWLGDTQDALAALGTRTLADVIEAGLGRDSLAVWPARVTVRSLGELLREGRWLDALQLPGEFELAPLGAASFLRGLFRLGAALRGGLADQRGPFALAVDPYALDRASLGALFALLPFGAAFARRQLGVSAGAMGDHRRTLSRVLLVASREAALRVLLREPALTGTRSFTNAYTERTHQALGCELPPSALGCVFTPRSGDAQRFAGLLLACARDLELTRTHDEDWFRNPRAVAEVRETARLPAVTLASEDELGRGAEAARALVSAL